MSLDTICLSWPTLASIEKNTVQHFATFITSLLLSIIEYQFQCYRRFYDIKRHTHVISHAYNADSYYFFSSSGPRNTWAVSYLQHYATGPFHFESSTSATLSSSPRQAAAANAPELHYLLAAFHAP